MTRNEAKSKLIDTFKNIPFSELKIGDLNNVIDKIYDDFEKEKLTFGDYTFTSCDDCKNKIDGIFQEVCNNCKRFYGCYFEKKEM